MPDATPFTPASNAAPRPPAHSRSHLARILILGGGGMLAHAFKSILAASHPASEVYSPPRAALDILHRPSLDTAFHSFRPTLVLNCAAHTKVDLCDYQRDLAHAINAVAPGRAAALAAVHNIPFVHFSTDFVFPGDSARPWLETDPTNPKSEYGRSKLAGEMAVTAACPDALILRTSWLYGPGGPSFPATMLRVATAARAKTPPGQTPAPLTVVADQHGSPTYTLDLAQITLELIAANAKGLFHVSNSGETTWHAFATATLTAFNVQSAVTPITTREWESKTPWSAHRPARSTLDCSKAEAALRHPLATWQQGLAKYRALSAV